jgi:hypothetical protein
LALPVTKVSKVRPGFSRARSKCSVALGISAAAAETGEISPLPPGNRSAASAAAPSTANTIATGRCATRDAACAICSENWERIASSFSRLGAPIVSVAVDSSKSIAFSGLIQAENCCGVSSLSSSREQSCQMSCIEFRVPLFVVRKCSPEAEFARSALLPPSRWWLASPRLRYPERSRRFYWNQ